MDQHQIIEQQVLATFYQRLAEFQQIYGVNLIPVPNSSPAASVQVTVGVVESRSVTNPAPKSSLTHTPKRPSSPPTQPTHPVSHHLQKFDQVILEHIRDHDPVTVGELKQLLREDGDIPSGLLKGHGLHGRLATLVKQHQLRYDSQTKNYHSLNGHGHTPPADSSPLHSRFNWNQHWPAIKRLLQQGPQPISGIRACLSKAVPPEKLRSTSFNCYLGRLVEKDLLRKTGHDFSLASNHDGSSETDETDSDSPSDHGLSDHDESDEDNTDEADETDTILEDPHPPPITPHDEESEHVRNISRVAAKVGRDANVFSLQDIYQAGLARLYDDESFVPDPRTCALILLKLPGVVDLKASEPLAAADRRFLFRNNHFSSVEPPPPELAPANNRG